MRTRRITTAILVGGFVVMLAWNAPGQLSYDAVVQLANGRAGFYNSWHPPLMAWLLGVFDAILPGTFLFLLFQGALLLAGLLALLRLRTPTWVSAVLALAIVLTPQWLLYQGEVWKDILFANAAIAGFAGLALAERRFRWGLVAASGVLLVLAASVRQNGVVLLPVAAVTLGLIVRRQGKPAWRTGLSFLAGTLLLGMGLNLALAVHSDGGDGAAAEIQLAQAWDLAGALARDPGLTLPSLAADDPALEHVLRTKGAALYTPLRNDPFAADPVVQAALADAADGAVSMAWRGLVLDHPLLYLRTRMAVFGRVLSTPDPAACHLAMGGVTGPPELLRSLGLTPGVRPKDQTLLAYDSRFIGTPVLSHVTWGLLALALLAGLLWRRQPGDLALAGLLVGVLLFSVTFVIISIACDYRYLAPLDFCVMATALAMAGKRA